MMTITPAERLRFSHFFPTAILVLLLGPCGVLGCFRCPFDSCMKIPSITERCHCCIHNTVGKRSEPLDKSSLFPEGEDNLWNTPGFLDGPVQDQGSESKGQNLMNTYNLRNSERTKAPQSEEVGIYSSNEFHPKFAFVDFRSEVEKRSGSNRKLSDAEWLYNAKIVFQQIVDRFKKEFRSFARKEDSVANNVHI